LVIVSQNISLTKTKLIGYFGDSQPKSSSLPLDNDDRYGMMAGQERK